MLLRPQERLAALLAGRDVALACEELALRARLDLDQGRQREAALQLAAALDAALAELEGWRGTAADRRAHRGAARHRAAVDAAARAALEGGLQAEHIEAVEAALGRLEATLRARTASLWTDERWAAVDAYIAERLAPAEAALDRGAGGERRRRAAGDRRVAGPGPAARAAGAAVRRAAILEIGTLGGYSTIWLARALPPDGRLVTLEADPNHAEVARANLARAGLVRAWSSSSGPALETLPRRGGPVRPRLHRRRQGRSADYLALALERSRPGTLIVADNVVRGGAVVDAASDDPRVRGVRRLVEAVAAEPRLIGTALQTVGAKGWDGLALALVV